MDGDTTRKKESYEKILSAFADEEADIPAFSPDIRSNDIVKFHHYVLSS